MSVQKLPKTVAHAATEKAGQKLVDKKLLTQAKLDRLLKNPVISDKERAQASKIIGAVREQLHGSLRIDKHMAVNAFAGAVVAEHGAAERLKAARTALREGAIDDALFARISGGTLGVRDCAELWKAFSAADGKARAAIGAVIATAGGEAAVEGAVRDLMGSVAMKVTMAGVMLAALVIGAHDVASVAPSEMASLLQLLGATGASMLAGSLAAKIVKGELAPTSSAELKMQPG